MWIVERQDGQVVLLASQPDPVRDGVILRQAQVDRAPAMDGSEDWDWDAGLWVVNVDRAEAWIDRTHRMQYGPASIEVAHAVKELEARLYLQGTVVDGALAAEAAATGQELADLVDAVIANAETERAAEVERIVLKRTVRAG